MTESSCGVTEDSIIFKNVISYNSHVNKCERMPCKFSTVYLSHTGMKSTHGSKTWLNRKKGGPKIICSCIPGELK